MKCELLLRRTVPKMTKHKALLPIFFLLTQGAACGRGPTLLPISVIKAEPTRHFPRPWDGFEPVPSAGFLSVYAPTPELSPRPGKAAREGSIALIVGVEKYRKGLRDASGAETDARLFSDFAEKTLGLPRRNIHLLLGSDATKSSVDAEIGEWLVRNASPSADVFFYFAGHGAPDPKSKAAFLLPWDADPKYITTQGISIEKLAARLSRTRAATVFAFIDACFSGAGGRSVLPEGARPVILRGAAPKPPPASNVILMTATGPDEITGVAPTGNGLFSYYLFKGLNGAADADGDLAVTVDELSIYVSTTVADESRRQARDQVPQTTGLTPKSRKLPIALFSPP